MQCAVCVRLRATPSGVHVKTLSPLLFSHHQIHFHANDPHHAAARDTQHHTTNACVRWTRACRHRCVACAHAPRACHRQFRHCSRTPNFTDCFRARPCCSSDYYTINACHYARGAFTTRHQQVHLSRACGCWEHTAIVELQPQSFKGSPRSIRSVYRYRMRQRCTATRTRRLTT